MTPFYRSGSLVQMDVAIQVEHEGSRAIYKLDEDGRVETDEDGSMVVIAHESYLYWRNPYPLRSKDRKGREIYSVETFKGNKPKKITAAALGYVNEFVDGLIIKGDTQIVELKDI